MSNEPFIDFLMKNSESNIPKFMLKKILKQPAIKAKLEMEIDLDKAEDKVTSRLKSLLKKYKDDGYTVNETIEEFERQLQLYPAIKFMALPKLLYTFWDRLD